MYRHRQVKAIRENLEKIIEFSEKTYFVTLTFSEHVNDEEAKHYIRMLKQRIKRSNKDTVGLWTREFTQAGRPHFHLIVSYWDRQFWNHGFQHVQLLNKNDKEKIANYIVKEISKNCQDRETKGKKKYGYIGKWERVLIRDQKEKNYYYFTNGHYTFKKSEKNKNQIILEKAKPPDTADKIFILTESGYKCIFEVKP